MKKVNYKGRCEKRKVSKCRDVCRSYSRIQSAMVDILEKDDMRQRIPITIRPYGRGQSRVSIMLTLRI